MKSTCKNFTNTYHKSTQIECVIQLFSNQNQNQKFYQSVQESIVRPYVHEFAKLVMLSQGPIW